MKKKKEKKTNIVLCIKKRTFIEKKPHSFCPVLSRFQLETLLSYSSNKKYIESHLHQCVANPVNALVGGKIVGYGDNYAFQEALNLSAKVTKIKFLSQLKAFRLNLNRIR